MGWLTLLLTCLQVAGAVALRVTVSWTQRVTVLLVGIVAWLALIGRELIPFWFGHV